MTTLILGASGKTGRLVVCQLLAQKEPVRVIVRSAPDFYAALPGDLIHDNRLSVVEASILEISNTELNEQVQGCTAVISCLGHNLNFKGIYGQPRRLVTEAVKRITLAINNSASPNAPIRFVLMNTTGNQNTQMGEQVSIAQKVIIWLIRKLLPPHADNEEAAEFLQTSNITNNANIEWSVVRPDTLTDEVDITNYETHSAPIRSAIFNAGITSRINVAHFMSALATNSKLWMQWKTKMPVIYNKVS